MTPITATESGELLRTLDAGLRAAGMDADAVLARLGITPAVLRRQTLRTPLAGRLQYFEAVRAVTGLQDPVPLLARHIPVPGRFVLTYLLLSSASLREDWQRTSQYLRLVSDALDGRLLEDGDTARCVIASGPLADAGDAAAERLLTRGIQLVLQGMVRGPLATAIELRGPAPANAPDYVAAFGCAVRFEAAQSALCVPRAVLDTPSPFEDAALLRVHLAHADAAMTALDRRDTVRRVQQLIAQRLERGAPTLEHCAAALQCTPRQLRHALARAGSSYARVLDDFRRELSQRLLADPQAELSEISYLAGFSEQSAFQRAFRRWTQMTPLAWRSARAASA